MSENLRRAEQARDQAQTELARYRADESQRRELIEASSKRADALARELTSVKAEVNQASERYRQLLREKTPTATSGSSMASSIVTSTAPRATCRSAAAAALSDLGATEVHSTQLGMSGDIKGYSVMIMCLPEFRAIEYLVIGPDGDVGAKWTAESQRAVEQRLSN
jgi:hypothetical protein